MPTRPIPARAVLAVLICLIASALCAWLAADELSRRTEVILVMAGAVFVMGMVLPKQRRWRAEAVTPGDESTSRRSLYLAAAGFGTFVAALLTGPAESVFLAVAAGLALGMAPCVIRNALIPENV